MRMIAKKDFINFCLSGNFFSLFGQNPDIPHQMIQSLPSKGNPEETSYDDATLHMVPA
jgi:hypothetical protein